MAMLSELTEMQKHGTRTMRSLSVRKSKGDQRRDTRDELVLARTNSRQPPVGGSTRLILPTA
jgi:hypothetical protein